MSRPPVVLSIAGSDPSGGAGIQADLKTFSALGAYGTTVITALTAQSTLGVTGIHAVPPAFVRQQLDTLVADVRVDAIKIGMLGDAATVRAVAGFLGDHPGLAPVVLDPVMVATSGARLLAEEAEQAIGDLLPHACVLTPNIPEAAVLLGEGPATSTEDLLRQARALRARGARAVLAKGGHLTGHDATDVWIDDDGEHLLGARRVPTANTHGTGCSLSSAIAALLPRSGSPLNAAREAKTWLSAALEGADTLEIGHGPGPVHHFHRWWDQPVATR